MGVLKDYREGKLRSYAFALSRYAPAWIGWEDLYQEGVIALWQTGYLHASRNAMKDVLRKYGRFNRDGWERAEEDYMPYGNYGADPARVYEIKQYFEAMGRLEKRERAVLEAVREGRRQKEVAEMYGCTEARVSQVRRKAERKMQRFVVAV